MADRADALKTKPRPIPPRPGQAAGGLAVGLVLAFLAVGAAEVAWMRWVLSEPLPNAGNIGGHVTRSLFAWRAIPHVVPGVDFAQSYFGMALKELSHVENLPERLPNPTARSSSYHQLAASLSSGHVVDLTRPLLSHRLYSHCLQ